MSTPHFRLHATDGEARVGTLTTPHGDMPTPAFMPVATQGAIKAMNHRVRLSDNRAAERFTFSFFSLPFPQRAFEMPGRGSMTSEAYFEAYGALF